jgi:hypothetical protein
MSRHCIIRIAAIAGLTLVLLLGCGGLNQQPLAPDRAATPQTLASSKALPRLAKIVHTRKDKGWFYPDQEDSLSVSFPAYGDNQTVRVEQATFTVAKGAITEKTYITMEASTGALLKEAAFDFSPDGLTFKPLLDATLTVVLSGPVNAQKLQAYHIQSSGKVTTVPHKVTALGGNRWQVTIQVPGFSTYTLGDELVPEADSL